MCYYVFVKILKTLVLVFTLWDFSTLGMFFTLTYVKPDQPFNAVFYAVNHTNWFSIKDSCQQKSTQIMRFSSTTHNFLKRRSLQQYYSEKPFLPHLSYRFHHPSHKVRNANNAPLPTWCAHVQRKPPGQRGCRALRCYTVNISLLPFRANRT